MNIFSKKPTRYGFSLIELLVSIAIITLISAVVLMRYGMFNSVILLRSLAYEMALSLREAQTLGVSVRGDGGVFSSAYGVHFSVSSVEDRRSYILFVEPSLVNRYDPGEELSVFNIGQGNFISRICINNDANCNFTSLDVVFRRPEPDALFTLTPSAGNVADVSIKIQAPDGNERTVRVYTTGQIAVE